MKKFVTVVIVMCLVFHAGGNVVLAKEIPSYSDESIAARTVICPNCGASNPERAKFCSQCGRKLEASDFSSEDRQKIKRAGEHLTTYSTLYYVGTGLSLLGLGVAIASEDSGVTGLVFAAVGTIMTLIAPGHVGAAGSLLQEVGKKNNGE